MKIFRRTYDWILHWADTPYGTLALFLLAMAESSFFPLSPDFLLMALSLSIPARAFSYAAICSIGSILGGIIGYLIGFLFMKTAGCAIIGFYHGQGLFDRIAVTFDAHSFWAVLIAAMTPIPYKVFTIAAGALHSHFGNFLIASAIGRPIRFFSVSLLIFFFGKPVKKFIDDYFNYLSATLIALIIAGFAILTYFSNHTDNSDPFSAHSSFFKEVCLGFR